MTRSQVTLLCLRLAALYLLEKAIWLVPNLGLVFVHGLGPDDSPPAYVLIASPLTFAALGIALFLAAPAIARRGESGAEPLRLGDRSEIGGLALRIAGIVLWNDALLELSNLGVFASPPNPNPLWLQGSLAAGVAVTLALIGTWFFVRGAKIAPRLFQLPGASAAMSNLAHLQLVAFSIAGVWMLGDSIPHLIGLLTASLERGNYYGSAGELGSAITRTLLGLTLFFGSGLVLRLWTWVRTAGLPEARRSGS